MKKQYINPPLDLFLINHQVVNTLRYIFFLTILLTTRQNSFGQSILGDKLKYQVKNISNISYEAVIPLKCGDNKTIKNTMIVFYTEKISRVKIDSIFKIQSFEILNQKSKLKCKNINSWNPNQISVFGSDMKISAIVKGRAENSYGNQFDVSFHFKWENGEFVELSNF